MSMRARQLMSLAAVVLAGLGGGAASAAAAPPLVGPPPPGTQLIEQFKSGDASALRDIDSGYGYVVWISDNLRRPNLGTVNVLGADGAVRRFALRLPKGRHPETARVRRINDRAGVAHVVVETGSCGQDGRCKSLDVDLSTGVPFVPWWSRSVDDAIEGLGDVEDGVVAASDSHYATDDWQCTITLRDLATGAVERTLPDVPDCTHFDDVFVRGPIVAIRGEATSTPTGAVGGGMQLMAIDTSAASPHWVRLFRIPQTTKLIAGIQPGAVSGGELLAAQLTISGKTFSQVGPVAVHRWDLTQLAAIVPPPADGHLVGASTFGSLEPVDVPISPQLAADLDAVGTTGTDLIGVLQRSRPGPHYALKVFTQIVRITGAA